MAAAFGFSVSDFITAINLVRDVINALNDTNGSSKEYLETISELRGLEIALIQVKAQYSETLQLDQRNALCQVVQECESTIEDFLASLHKYHGHLDRAGSRNKWKDAVRKVQWHLCIAGDVPKYRLRIVSHVQNIEMLLATIQM